MGITRDVCDAAKLPALVKGCIVFLDLELGLRRPPPLRQFIYADGPDLEQVQICSLHYREVMVESHGAPLAIFPGEPGMATFFTDRALNKGCGSAANGLHMSVLLDG